MDSNLIFNLEILGSTIVFALVARWYLGPRLGQLSLVAALTPLLLVHATRTVGLTMLAPNIVDPNLPQDFAVPAAYGDLASAVLALAALASLRMGSRIAPAIVWIFSVVGIADLVNAFAVGIQVGLPEFELGATWFIFTVLVPALIVTHGMIVLRLVRHARAGGGILVATSDRSLTSVMEQMPGAARATS